MLVLGNALFLTSDINYLSSEVKHRLSNIFGMQILQNDGKQDLTKDSFITQDRN